MNHFIVNSYNIAVISPVSQKINDRLRKELQNAQIATQGASPAHLLESLVEETQVLEFMVKQKLPQELIAKQMELQIMQDVINENNISNDYLDNLQKNIDEASKEVQTLIESRMAERGTQNDMLGPFRQQASMVARNKDMAVEQLDQVTRELREIETILQQKQQQVEKILQPVIKVIIDFIVFLLLATRNCRRGYSSR